MNFFQKKILCTLQQQCRIDGLLIKGLFSGVLGKNVVIAEASLGVQLPWAI